MIGVTVVVDRTPGSKRLPDDVAEALRNDPKRTRLVILDDNPTAWEARARENTSGSSPQFRRPAVRSRAAKLADELGLLETHFRSMFALFSPHKHLDTAPAPVAAKQAPAPSPAPAEPPARRAKPERPRESRLLCVVHCKFAGRSRSKPSDDDDDDDDGAWLEEAAGDDDDDDDDDDPEWETDAHGPVVSRRRLLHYAAAQVPRGRGPSDGAEHHPRRATTTGGTRKVIEVCRAALLIETLSTRARDFGCVLVVHFLYLERPLAVSPLLSSSLDARDRHHHHPEIRAFFALAACALPVCCRLWERI